jgi:hypothetical protein
MNSIARPPHDRRLAGRTPDDLDGVLRAFFRSEMPEPWPTLTPPANNPRKAQRPVRRTSFSVSSRLSLAAAVALFVTGYLALASRFPLESNDSGPGVSSLHSTLGSKDAARLRKKVVPQLPPRTGEAVEQTSNGGEALLQWEQVPGRLFMRIEEKRPPRP